MDHLTFQRNDVTDSEYDCRRKYVARQLVINLASECRLDHFPQFAHGPFKLFSEDFRPACVLLNESGAVSGVIDWELTIAAPAGFSFSLPWWLLIRHPESWPQGLDAWEEQYVPRLETFLEALRIEEDVAIEKKMISEDQRLSPRMRESWDSGAFWVDYAAQHCWAFDQIYFTRLDVRFFGQLPPGADWLETRLPLLSEKQRSDKEPFVKQKMYEMENRTTVREPSDEVELRT